MTNAPKHEFYDEMRELELAQGRTNPGRLARMNRMLHLHAGAGSLVHLLSDPEVDWFRNARQRVRDGSADPGFVTFFTRLEEVLGTTKLGLSDLRYSANEHLDRYKVRRAILRPLRTEMTLTDELRARLLVLLPEGLDIPEGEDPADVIWWHYMFLIQEHIAAGRSLNGRHGATASSTPLGRFIPLQGLLLRTNSLSQRQTEFWQIAVESQKKVRKHLLQVVG